MTERIKKKQKRPFIQEHVEKKWIILFCTIIISSVFVIAVTTLRFSFTIILGLMLLNQLLYTVPPIRLKDTIFAPFSSTATNSILRMASCAVLLGNIFIVPLSVYIFMYTASMGTYIMYKSKQTAASALTLISGNHIGLCIFSRRYESNTICCSSFTRIFGNHTTLSFSFHTEG